MLHITAEKGSLISLDVSPQNHTRSLVLHKVLFPGEEFWDKFGFEGVLTPDALSKFHQRKMATKQKVV